VLALQSRTATTPSASARPLQGAVLATDALELTGGRTPTTAIAALLLKHQFELEAECQFSGVEYHLKIDARLDEIVEETKAISRWFADTERRNARLNAEMGVIYGLINILRNYNQFDELQACVNRARHLHHTLWMRQKCLRAILWPILRYIEVLLSSFSLFVSILLMWTIGLSIFYWLFNKSYSGLIPGLADAVSSFFSTGPPMTHSESLDKQDLSWGHITVACVAIVGGFVHLGVFI
jgi:hypothetical protein